MMTLDRRNILLLSAGRRVSLARAFAAVAEEHSAKFICADMRPELSAACQDNAIAIALPNVGEPNYTTALKALCREHAIGLVVPTIDTELAKLAAARQD